MRALGVEAELPQGEGGTRVVDDGDLGQRQGAHVGAGGVDGGESTPRLWAAWSRAWRCQASAARTTKVPTGGVAAPGAPMYTGTCRRSSVVTASTALMLVSLNA